MNRGRIEAEGTPREVFGRPATPFVARFFGWNVLEGRVLALAGAGPAWAVQVALPGGVALWGVLGTDAPVAAGEGVALCVRREHVRIAPAAAEGAGADHTDQALRGKIRASSFQGLHDEHLVEFGGVELRAVQPSCGIEGGEATILLDRRDCIVLPAG
jgi:ABC-type Fe3+/spermidine/putrescine transport system ATPase subunit